MNIKTKPKGYLVCRICKKKVETSAETITSELYDKNNNLQSFYRIEGVYFSTCCDNYQIEPEIWKEVQELIVSNMKE